MSPATKFLAKIASAVAKPDGLVVVPEGEELEFLHPLPVTRVWGVGEVLGARLADRGILTVGDLAKVPEAALVSWLGTGGRTAPPRTRLEPRPEGGGPGRCGGVDRVSVGDPRHA